MSKTRSDQLSEKLARIAGLRLRPPRPGEEGHTPAGSLRGLLPEEFFQWRKCPTHSTWLQPELKPFYHWHCGALDFCNDKHPLGGFQKGYVNCQGHRCTFMRSAKLRTRIERRIFAVMQFLEENA